MTFPYCEIILLPDKSRGSWRISQTSADRISIFEHWPAPSAESHAFCVTRIRTELRQTLHLEISRPFLMRTMGPPNGTYAAQHSKSCGIRMSEIIFGWRHLFRVHLGFFFRGYHNFFSDLVTWWLGSKNGWQQSCQPSHLQFAPWKPLGVILAWDQSSCHVEVYRGHPAWKRYKHLRKNVAASNIIGII